MADQQDQSSSGGSVEKASASADASKRGKSTASGYRKRHNSNNIQISLEEKRRRQSGAEVYPLYLNTNPTTSSARVASTHHKVDDKKSDKSHGSVVDYHSGKIS